MPLSHALRLALPACALAIVVSAAPSLAFQPSVEVREGESDQDIVVTDLAGRGDSLALSTDVRDGSFRSVGLDRSNDAGVDWVGETVTNGLGSFESQATVCAGHAVMIFRSIYDATRSNIDSFVMAIEAGLNFPFGWTQTAGSYRKPDIACVANSELVAAWFEKVGGDWKVRVTTRVVDETNSSPQTFNLGTATPSNGLAIATSATRVYVAWFRGNELKLRRFSISSASHHDLTSLGTTTIATLPNGMYPEIGADGDRVILAYMDRADLKVRRSTNRGASWGSAKTIRNEPFPGEIGAYPTTVAVKGSRIAIGALEVSEGGGKGLGYRSTDGGSSYARQSTRSSGRIVSGLVKVGSSYKYAEAYDQSIDDPLFEVIRFRRQ